MPLTQGRKAIRFPTLRQMNVAIETNAEFQYRHLILRMLSSQVTGTTRKHISGETVIPINAMSKAIASLLSEGALVETYKMECPVTGRYSMGIKFNPDYRGLY